MLTDLKALKWISVVLTFFGFIHGEGIGIGRSPAVAVSYLLVAAILFGCARSAELAPGPAGIVDELPADPREKSIPCGHDGRRLLRSPR